MPVETVQTREDWWVDVPAAEVGGIGMEMPIQLRPGTDDGMVSVKAPGAVEFEVKLPLLRIGLKRIEDEGRR